MLTKTIHAIKYWAVERSELKRQIAMLQSDHQRHELLITELEQQINNKKVCRSIFELEKHEIQRKAYAQMSNLLREADSHDQEVKEMQSEIDQLRRDMTQMGQELAIHRLSAKEPNQ